MFAAPLSVSIGSFTLSWWSRLAVSEASPPLTPDPETARQWVSQHQEDPVSWVDTLINWLWTIFTGQFGKVNEALSDTPEWPLRVAAAVVIISLIIWIVYQNWRVPKSKATARANPVIEVPLTAAEFHRQYLQLREDDPDAAVVAAFRYLVMAVDEANQTTSLSGRTAGEITSWLIRLHRHQIEPISIAAQSFNLAAYGTSPSPRCRTADADLIANLAHHLTVASVTTGMPPNRPATQFVGREQRA